MSYHWEKATTEHAAHIAANCRQADRDELWAAGMLYPAEALDLALRDCPDALTGFVNGEPVCMFGVTPASILGSLGCPWMIGTDGIKANAKGFLKGSKQAIKTMKEPYSILANMVDARHTEAIRWLKWLGFTIHDPMPYGPFNLMFHPFEMR